MGERLKGEARERMQAVIKQRLAAMSDIPDCHCMCGVSQHEIEAEMHTGEVVLIVEGHDSDRHYHACVGYETDKDGFDGIWQDMTRGVQTFLKDIFRQPCAAIPHSRCPERRAK